MALFRNEAKAGEAPTGNLPRHIAVIMDGNGRWAQRRGLPRTAGHAAGAETFRRVASYCKGLGLEYLTVYAFSTENWKRPPEEVDTIMALLEKYLLESIEKMERDGIRLRILGDTGILSPRLRELIARTDEITAHIEGFQANVCLNYGGRDEILRAARLWADEVLAGAENTPDEKRFSSLLWTGGLPDPDLLIRTGGELRLSNFLLWQCAYAEFYFTDTLWPDFDSAEVDRAIAAFQKRQRRFGGL